MLSATSIGVGGSSRLPGAREPAPISKEPEEGQLAWLFLLFLLLLLGALSIYKLLRRAIRKLARAAPSTDEKSPASLVVVLADALAKPRVQLLSRVRRQFVEDQFATAESAVEEKPPKETQVKSEDAAEERKEERQQQKCRLCGRQAPQPERCHSHSPRPATRLGPPPTLTGGRSVSPISCSPEPGVATPCNSSGRLASRRLLRQAAGMASSDRCLRLFRAGDECCHQEPPGSLQESARELMRPGDSDRSLCTCGRPAAAAETAVRGSEGELASSASTSLGESDSGFGVCRRLCSTCQRSKQGASPGASSQVAQSGRRRTRQQQQQQQQQQTQVVDLERQEVSRHRSLATRRMSVAGDQICRRAPANNSNNPRIPRRCFRRPSDTYLTNQQPMGTDTDSLNKSAYSSSGGSSSGIGVSGSACTNTPTASAFPYSSFVYSDSLATESKLFGGHQQHQLVLASAAMGNPLFPANLYLHGGDGRPLVASPRPELGLSQGQDADAEEAAAAAANSAASRKYSLPVQLEWQDTERLSPKCMRLLFDRNLRPALADQLLAGQQHQQQPPAAYLAGSSVAGGETRRSSQTITRQSSFWLADQSDQSVLSLANLDGPLLTDNEEPCVPARQQVLASASVDHTNQCAGEPPVPSQPPATRSARASLSSIAVLSGDSIESVKRRPIPQAEASTTTTTTIDQSKPPEVGSQAPLSARNSSSTTNGTLSGSSPSPPELAKPSSRILSGLSGHGTRRSKLKTRRHQRSEDGASKRRRAFKMRSAGHQHSAPGAPNRPNSKDEHWDDDDDDDDNDHFDYQAQADVAEMVRGHRPFGPIQSTCSLPQHMRKAGTTSCEGASTLRLPIKSARTDKKDSGTLERQCRELWKLRATLHDDSCFTDNWANYHQRLNRRYDSGYKSIEHQFSSSFESAPVRAAAGAQPAAAAGEPRPPSGCSSQATSAASEIENKMPHNNLELAEDQTSQDAQVTTGERECHSRTSKCSSSSSSNEDENNNNKM